MSSAANTRKPLPVPKQAWRLLSASMMKYGCVGHGTIMASCHEAQGNVREALNLLDQVVQIDQKYQLPKLEENTKRLQTLRARLAESVQPG